MAEAKPYYYVRFCWWQTQDLEKLSAKLKERFTLVRSLAYRKEKMEISIFKDTRDEIEVKADTLLAILSPTRAILFQKERAPFTKRDMDLRETILALYPRNRPTPFPWEFSIEPKFETKERQGNNP